MGNIIKVGMADLNVCKAPYSDNPSADNIL